MPNVKVLVVHWALPALTVTAEHPVMALPASVKLTVPVGDWPVTVAVSVTLIPTPAGLSELAKVVVLVPSGLAMILTSKVLSLVALVSSTLKIQ